METKIIEVRDHGTFMAMVCTKCSPANEEQAYYLRRFGFSSHGHTILMTKLDAPDRSSTDPYYWGDRTRAAAHGYIEQNWDSLKDGDVVDVECVLNEKPFTAAKKSERFEDPFS